jgi:hypothetical protein
MNLIGRGEVVRFVFRQVKMSLSAYIYEVCDTFSNIWYEVFKRIVNTRFYKIAYPKCKSFRITAWACQTFRRANERFQWLQSVTPLNTVLSFYSH